MNEDSNLNHSVRASKTRNSQRTMTLTDNRKIDKKTKDLQWMMTHALASTTLTDFPSVQGHFTHCWDFRSALRVTNSTVVAVPINSISDLYANSLQRFTLRKWSRVRCGVHTPVGCSRTTVNCKRSNFNKLKNLESRTRLRFCPKTANNGSHRSIMALCT